MECDSSIRKELKKINCFEQNPIIGSLSRLPESASYVVNSIREGCKRRARDPSEVDIVAFVWISISKEDPGKAKLMIKRVVAYFAPFLKNEELGAIGLSVSDFATIRKEIDRGRYDLASEMISDDMLRLGIIGTLAECIERLSNMEKAGVPHVSLGGPFGPSISSSVRIIGSEIIPSLK